MHVLELASCSLFLFLLSLSAASSAAGTTIPPMSGFGVDRCASSALDWYTIVVGETPCMPTAQHLYMDESSNYIIGATYGRLRQIDDLHC